MKRALIIFLNLFLWQSPALCTVKSPKTLQEPVKRESGELFPGVKKINDDLYMGKVTDHFYLAMERVNQKNIKMWQEYADRQRRLRVPFRYLPNADGSGRFHEVLDEYKDGKIKPSNEIWVAYASSTPVTKQAALNSYSAYDSFANPSIEMFVTVATSPEALITSHMGISRTQEAAWDLQPPPKRIKHPDQSVHLHSFAAKVMKIRDPKKVYMLTAPVAVMGATLMSKLPRGSVFVGDDLYQKKIEAAVKDPSTLLGKYALEEREGETAQERKRRLKVDADRMYAFYKPQELMSRLKSNPPRIIRTRNDREQKFTLQSHNKEPLVTFDQSNPIYQWMFTEPYYDSGLTLPYVLVDLGKLAAFGPLVTESPD